MEFDEPGSANQFSIKDHVGDLALVAVNGFTPQFPTAFGMRDTIRCSIAIVDSRNPDHVGALYPDAMVFGSKIVPQLRSSMHRIVLGRIALGTAKPGQNPPYQLDKFSADDAGRANAWVQANGPFEVQPYEDQGPAQQQPQQQNNPVRNNGGQQQGANPAFSGSAPAPGGSYTSPPQSEQPPF